MTEVMHGLLTAIKRNVIRSMCLWMCTIAMVISCGDTISVFSTSTNTCRIATGVGTDQAMDISIQVYLLPSNLCSRMEWDPLAPNRLPVIYESLKTYGDEKMDNYTIGIVCRGNRLLEFGKTGKPPSTAHKDKSDRHVR